MAGPLRLFLTPVVLAALAVVAVPPVEEAVAPWSSHAEGATTVGLTAPVPAIVAAGGWSYDVPDISVTVPSPPRARPVASRRTYGAAPALTGPVLEVAGRAIGAPYVHGGASLSGFDCSGFTSWVYAQLGVSLSRTVGGQRHAGTVTSSPVPGDLIWTSGHVGLYVAPGWQIDAPRPGKTVQVRPIWQSNPLYIHIG